MNYFFNPFGSHKRRLMSQTGNCLRLGVRRQVERIRSLGDQGNEYCEEPS